MLQEVRISQDEHGFQMVAAKVLVHATICFHRHIRGTEKTGGSAGPLVWVEGTAEIENSHKLQRGEQNWAKKLI